MSSAPSSAGARRPGAKVPLFTAEAWSPLKVQLFRALWIATSVAQIGIWAREAAGPWLMKLLTDGWHTQPEMVAKVVQYSNLPICLFSVFAGALADVLDRRRLLIFTHLWMLFVSVLLGLLTLAGFISPWGLLGLTFLLGVGTAATGPALQAVLPELVPPKDFALAINMNSVALNVARAVGPGMFILVVHFLHGTTGVGVSFLLTGISFVWAVWVLSRWKRAPQRAAIHGEEMWGAIRAGYRYVLHSPANRAILVRVAAFIIPALVMWAQVPTIATRQLHLGEQSYALLFAFMGIGAVFGVFLMPGLHGRYRIDPVVNVCTAGFGLGLIALSFVHTLALAAIIMVWLGINWVIVPTNFNTATQKSVPLWVKGRAISFYLTVLFGSFALGAAIWGRVTTRYSIDVSLLWGGISMIVLLVLAIWFPLTLNEGKDLALARSGPPSDDVLGPKPAGSGPVQLTIKYSLPEHRVPGFTDLLHDLRRTRLRNGANKWRVERSNVEPAHCELSECVLFGSWQEYTRYHSRTTKWDQMLEALAREYHVSTETSDLQRGFDVKPVKAKPVAATPATPATPSDTVVAPGAPAVLDYKSAPVSLERPMQQRVAKTLDRIIDEMFLAYDRISNPGVKRSTWE